MASCGLADCNDIFTDGVHCSVCDKDFHFQCAGITESGYRKLGDRKFAWRCTKCKNTNQVQATPSSVTSEVLAEIRSLTVKLAPLDKMASDLDALRADMQGMKSAVEDVRKTMMEYSKKLDKVEERVTVLENKQPNIKALEAKVIELEYQLSAKEQWSRMNNVEIKGVPESKGENLFNIIMSIGDKIAYPIQQTLINFVTRVPNRGDNARAIIVCFNNRYVKENYIAAARVAMKASKLCPLTLGLQGTNKIYINDHLTTQNKMLLSKTKKAAEEAGFEYKWSRNCKIMVRKDSTSPIIHILSEKDLLKIK